MGHHAAAFDWIGRVIIDRLLRPADNDGVAARKNIAVAAIEVVEARLRFQEDELPLEWRHQRVGKKRLRSEPGAIDDHILWQRRELARLHEFAGDKCRPGLQILLQPRQQDRRLDQKRVIFVTRLSQFLKRQMSEARRRGNDISWQHIKVANARRRVIPSPRDAKAEAKPRLMRLLRPPQHLEIGELCGCAILVEVHQRGGPLASGNV